MRIKQYRTPLPGQSLGRSKNRKSIGRRKRYQRELKPRRKNKLKPKQRKLGSQLKEQSKPSVNRFKGYMSRPLMRRKLSRSCSFDSSISSISSLGSDFLSLDLRFLKTKI